MTTIEVAVPRTEGISDTVDRIKRYLPSNYRVDRWRWVPEDRRVHPADAEVILIGEDVAGWTAEGYVIPRLASGLMFGKVVSDGA